LRWDVRIARARTLAERSAAAEPLVFYAALAKYQKSLAGPESDSPAASRTDVESRSLIETLDLERALDAVPGFLAWLPSVAPAPLAKYAADARAFGRDEWQRFFTSYLAARGDVEEVDIARPHVFVIEVVLQPFAEREASRHGTASNESTVARCPRCDVLPVVGVLREAGQGAKRSLLCALCLTEWNYPRVICPVCREQQFDALPVFTAEQFGHVRIEACDACRRYLKTIDLTKDGHAVAEVDDIASVSLDLWARERGYVRIRTNLLGL
jgi:FdhE protein